MSCCAPAISSFILVPTLTIAYSPTMIQDFGPRPKVQVWIQDESGQFVKQNVRVALDGYPNTSAIQLDFGGPATGVVRVQ